MECTIALIQADFPFAQIMHNLVKAEQLVREAAQRGANLVCLPESFNQGYSAEHISKMVEACEPINGTTISKMRTLAAQLNIYLVAPLFLRTEDGACENTSVLISDSGTIVGTYAKSHLVPGPEMDYVRPGRKYPVFETKYGRIGMIICNDMSFPESSRILAVQGADIIIVSAAWRAVSLWESWWRKMCPVRALDNQAVVAAVNRVGPAGQYAYSGESLLADPNGDILEMAGKEEEAILLRSVSIDKIRQSKNTFLTLFRDRRAEDYGLLCQKDLWQTWSSPNLS